MSKANRQLGAYLRRQRQAASLSMYKLAQQAGVPRSQVMRIERGEIWPRPETLARLASALKVEVEDFYAVAGYVSPNALPDVEPYLRAKFGMSGPALREAVRVFDELREKEGGDAERGG